MSRRNEIVEQILSRRLSAIIRTSSAEVAGKAMAAAVDGGFRLVEFTLTTPGAIELIAEFSKREGVLVGAGTVLTVEQARAAVAAGATFLVSPIFDPQIVGEAHRLDVAAIPGTFTATEMETAHRAGADFVKLFPAPADVPTYVAALRGPLPHLRIYPTNGVTKDNVHAVLAAGAAGVGFVGPLFEPGWIAAQNYAAIRARAEEIHAAAPR